MKKIVFTEEFCSPETLFPFTLTRQIQDIRVGILTIREKWEKMLDLPSFDKNEGDYKDGDASVRFDEGTGDLIYLIHGNILPTPALVKKVRALKPGSFLSIPQKESLVYCISAKEIIGPDRIRMKDMVEYNGEVKEIRFPWEIFQLNRWALVEDFQLLTAGRKSAKPDESNSLINPKAIFIEKGARISFSVLNATEGPIYIGKDAELMEGTLIRGPVAIGASAVVKMGTRIYGATTIGPRCTVGGEIKNSVFFGHSNKAHDGYIGDAVIGEWCNMGAGTSNSNVKNNASSVQIHTPGGKVDVGLKCGVIMGDYTRTAINTSINTGTVIGVCANVFGGGLTPKFIPSFSWGSDGVERYRFDKAITDIENWKALKEQRVTDTEKTILKHIFDHY